MHGGERNLPGGGGGAGDEGGGVEARVGDSALSAGKLGDGADEDGDLLGADAIGDGLGEPGGDEGGLGLLGREGADDRRGAVEDGLDAGAVLLGALELDEARRQQEVGAAADLAGGAVVHLEGARAAADLDALGRPGEGGAEDALADVAGEEQAVDLAGNGGLEEAELGEGEVLGLVDEDVVEGRPTLGREGDGGVVQRLCIGFQAAGAEGGAGAGEDRPEGVAAVGGQAGAAAGARKVAVAGGVADVARIDDQPPFVAQEGGADGGALGGASEDGRDVMRGGDADRTKQALVLGEGGGPQVGDAEVRGRVLSPRPLYPGHAAGPHSAALVMADQQLAGLIMLVACPVVYLLAATVIVASWLGRIERRPLVLRA